MQKIRMGMVGGGQGAFIGDVHRMAARLDGHIDLVCGAFSRDHANTLETGTSLGLNPDRCYASFEAMMAAEAALPEDQRMQFVAIVTPNHMHLPVAKAALAAGFHVLSDKPATRTVAEAMDLATAVEQSGLLFGLTHTYLGYPMVHQARHMVASGAIGAVRKIHVEYPQGWLSSGDDSGKQAAWRTDPKLAGPSGCMGDIGTHAHNLAEFVAGQVITHIAADMTAVVAGRALDDDGAALFKTDQGARGTLMASQICAGEENSLKIRIYGEKGGLEWHQMEPNTLYFKPLTGRVELYRAGTDKDLCSEALRRCRLPSGHPEGYLEAFANLYRDFAIAISDERQSGSEANGVPGIEEGIRGMKFVEAMVESAAASGAWTSI